MIDGYCTGCAYRAYISGGVHFCDYIGFTGHARSLICPAGRGCTVRKGPETGRPRAGLDEELCMELYKRGWSDAQMARYFGLSKTPIANWRKRNGFQANGKNGGDRRSPQARMAYLNGR